jgi:hypothetical protein
MTIELVKSACPEMNGRLFFAGENVAEIIKVLKSNPGSDKRRLRLID